MCKRGKQDYEIGAAFYQSLKPPKVTLVSQLAIVCQQWRVVKGRETVWRVCDFRNTLLLKQYPTQPKILNEKLSK